MKQLRLTKRDWEEVLFALQTKAEMIEEGTFDDVPGELSQRHSKTAAWAGHLRRIMVRIQGALGAAD